MAEWTRVTGTLTAWNEENATKEDLLAAVQEVLPVDVCPTWFNRDTVEVLNVSLKRFLNNQVRPQPKNHWIFTLPVVKTSEVPESESLSVHLVSYVRDNAVFLGTDADSGVLDTHKPYDPDPDSRLDSWNTLHTSHCITYGEGSKSEETNWLGTWSDRDGQGTFYTTKLYDSVISFYSPHVAAAEPKNSLNLYPPPACQYCLNDGHSVKRDVFRPKYLAIAPSYEYHYYGPYTYRSVDNPDRVYTQTHGCFFLVGDAEDYAPQAESAQG